MPFEMENAQRRLAATEHARMLLNQVTTVLTSADVRNARVVNALVICLKELSDYKHVTEYAIHKRLEREKESKKCRRSASW